MPITFTNVHNIPAALADAITSDQKHSVGTLSVTQLLAPPRIRRLIERHTVTVDVSERMWAMVGKGLHAVLEQHGKSTEVQIVGRIRETWISGTIDSTDDGVLRDWKMTSVRAGARAAEWEAQLNLYSWLMQRGTLRVAPTGNRMVPNIPSIPKALEVTAIYRDWIGARAAAGPDSNYPPAAVQTFPIRQWQIEEADRFLRERVALHLAANEVALPDRCSDEERWHRGDTWAVKKVGGKKAMRGGVHTSEENARLFAEISSVGGLMIEHRPGADVRCESYCPARTVCPHGIAVAAQVAKNQTTTTTNEAEEQPA